MSTNETTRIGRRMDLACEHDFQLGELIVQPASRKVVYRGQAELLEPRVMRVLVALARRSGEVVSRAQLIDACWDARTVGDDAINRVIAILRRLAAPTAFSVETIPRVGYRLIASPSAEAKPSATPTVESDVPTPQSRTNSWALGGRTYFGAALAAIALVASCLCGIWLWPAKEGGSATPPDFVVLPFDTAGAEDDGAYLADAIPASIGSQLSRLGFQVVSPTASFRYRESRKNEAADTFAPRYIIDGSVRSVSGSLHVLARVDSVSPSVTVWSQEFTVEMSDADRLLERVATAIAGLYVFNPALRSIAKEPPSVTSSLTRVTTRLRSGDAIGAHLAAREWVRESPHEVLALIWHAVATANALDLLPLERRAAALADARHAANAAAQRAPGGAPAALQAVTPPVEWLAREHLVRAGIVNEFSDAANLRNTLARLLLDTGRVNEAVSVAQQAVLLDPLSSAAAINHARAIDSAGRDAEAEIVLGRIHRLWPHLPSVERLRLSAAVTRRDLRSAAAMLQDPLLRPMLEPSALHRPHEALVRAMQTGDREDIADAERQCADPTRLGREGGSLCLIGLAFLGKLDAFFDLASLVFPDLRGDSSAERDRRWLSNPLANRSLHVLFRADMQAIRADERFISIASRMGLLDYWQASGHWPDFCHSEPASACAQMRAVKASE